MKVIVPLAGPEGEVEREFKEFKNLIEVNNKPLIKYIVDTRPYNFKEAVFILLKKTDEKYKVKNRLKKILGSEIEVFILEKVTEGAACSVLEYLEISRIKGDILIDLADQYLTLGRDFLDFIKMNKHGVKGIMPIFKSRYWKWSYAHLDKEGFVEEVQEKVNPPISDYATAGVYYFSNSSDYMEATKEMVRFNKRVKFNNKFFVSCVYNQLPKKSVIAFSTKIICPLGSIDGIRTFGQIIW